MSIKIFLANETHWQDTTVEHHLMQVPDPGLRIWVD